MVEFLYFFYSSPDLLLQLSPLQYAQLVEQITTLEKEYKHIASRVNLLLLNATKGNKVVQTGGIPATGSDLDLLL